MSITIMLTGKFHLGQPVITQNALASLTEEEVIDALARHSKGDWGDADKHDKEENEFALKEGFRLFSVYHSAKGVRFWVITEADRSTTTVLLPEDY